MVPLIRPHTPADRPALVAALAAVHQASRYPSVWPSDPAAFVCPPGARGWLAEGLAGEGPVLGSVVLRSDLTPAWAEQNGIPAERLALVGRLFVVPQARRMGVAQALLQTAQDAATQVGQRAALEVAAVAAPAIALYERLGWQRVATLPAHWQEADGSTPDMHVYLAPAAPSWV